MNLVDSSAWLEYLTAGPMSEAFNNAIEDTPRLLVPTICLYEVFKKIIRLYDDKKALEVMAVMGQGRIVDLDDQIAFASAKYSRSPWRTVLFWQQPGNIMR